MLLDDIYARDAPTDDAIRFSFAFARIEFALKSTGFFAVGGSREAIPNWDQFATSIDDIEEAATGDLAEAISYMYRKPPMAERVRDRTVGFEPAIPAVRSNVELFRMIRRVRNNLFHGGKVPYRDRDDELVRSSLSILRAVVEKHDIIATHLA